jgi:DNA repair protein RadC
MATVLVHAREAFRAAIISASHGILLMHHPSGDPLPSEADIRLTREMIRASDLIKIQMLDRVIVGRGQFTSLFPTRARNLSLTIIS